MSTSVHENADADLRFPIGRYRPPQHISESVRNEWIAELEALPENLENGSFRAV